MYKSCSKCGKIHPSNYNCTVGRVYRGGEERKQRSTYAWTKKSREIRDSALFCEVCKDQGVYNYRDLEVHHIDKLREREDGLLDNSNLICLCKEHHRQADNNEIDKDYLRKLADKREKNIPPTLREKNL